MPKRWLPSAHLRSSISISLATKDGKVVCFVQSAQKFKTRYATLGFNNGAMWPVAFALRELTAAEEAQIAAPVK